MVRLETTIGDAEPAPVPLGLHVALYPVIVAGVPPAKVPGDADGVKARLTCPFPGVGIPMVGADGFLAGS